MTRRRTAWLALALAGCVAGDTLLGDLLDLENILSNLQKADGIDRIAVHAHLEMQVRAG